MIDLITVIFSIIAAIAAIITLIFTIQNSKSYILHKIDKKEQEIRNIEDSLVRQFGHNRGRMSPITQRDIKKRKLKEEIEQLKRRL